MLSVLLKKTILEMHVIYGTKFMLMCFSLHFADSLTES